MIPASRDEIRAARDLAHEIATDTTEHWFLRAVARAALWLSRRHAA